MNENPLVTVNILSFNRKDELRNTLTKVFEQDYKNIEVIVVDNASIDGSSEMVKKEFPEVQLIQMEKNIGIAGWNEGFKVAKGEYVLVLDDDAYPDKNSVILSLQEFRNDIEIACITFNLIDINSGDFFVNNWLPLNKDRRTYWPVFVGCAFIVKMSRIPETFVFLDKYFIYQHELPMAAEIYMSRKKLLFVPEIIAYHNFKRDFKYNPQKDAAVFRNNLLYISNYLPKIFSFFYSIQIILFYLTRSIKYKWFSEYIEIICNNKFLNNQNRIKIKYFLQIRPLHLFNYSLLSKIKKI